MKDHNDSNQPRDGDPPRPGEDIDTGDRIAELAALADEPAGGFLERIRHSIQRRVFTADALDFGLMGFFQTFFSYLTLMLQGLGDTPRREGRKG